MPFLVEWDYPALLGAQSAFPQLPLRNIILAALKLEPSWLSKCNMHGFGALRQVLQDRTLTIQPRIFY
ncbi:hypothetical protein TRIATDRAFT_300548 [Trichoderma atroviride IMI 206040]|uniref:Uncharacterized protein n=1 Tax=Hypocrea atroviridis (strain ATCC 20476 / IMI 206040) TaxID=452589 RepID=G9NXW3_HYPAI|nr:uncharacterized protein TRIATDRAFT_300548 [Trichoderma atroviride IMI 206040]EHK44292.1 hypothetical protein TRIATDRAFT_300548 [Trichoderma atroviride IMI 206040]